MLKCEICGSSAIQDEIVSEVFHVNGQYQLVENIPASICTQCNQRTFSRETAEHIRKLMNTQQGMDETAYLLQEPANAQRLMESMANLRAGCNIELRELLPDK